MSVQLSVCAAWRRFAMTCLLFALSGCAGSDNTVRRGLLCDECERETQAIVNLGDAAVDELRDALRNGLTAAERNNYRAQAIEEFHLARRAKASQPGSSSALGDSTTVVDGAVSDVVATVQKRAAVSLRTIGTPNALAVLHQALLDAPALGWRADVLAMVQRLDNTSPIINVVVHATVASIPVGGNTTLTATVVGAGAVPQTVTWTSGSPAIATITQGGVVTRLNPGNVTLTACAVAAQAVCGVILLKSP